MSGKVILTGAKMALTGIVGTVVSVIAGTKVGEVVYSKTGNMDTAAAAGVLTGSVGLAGTTIGMIAIADHDAENYTEEDLKSMARINKVLDTTGTMLDTVGSAVKLVGAIRG